ncbi:sensor histidine kinase [Actinophytocola sp.]|uniref:sensor histidine kinase n=1 Tax=Actinophytocola sp. TaxID=1872138 RepID=UPI002D5220DD|nr:sensor histidine kinase [Actinophytocola sp.]HYQ67649.1 sensor histidine kinase [Actinophytocola sp.]
MRTGAAAGHVGYYHEALTYASDAELLAVVVPFLSGGVAEGEPTIVALGEQHAELVRAELPPEVAGRVEFHPGGDMYARPASAIRSYREMLAGHTAGGAGQIRIIGELPPAELGATWDWWARYESAINHSYDEFPLWSMCAYDTRVTPAHVLADVARTHPRTARPGDEHAPNADYVVPGEFLGRHTPVALDPLQLTPPAVDLQDPAAAETRAAIARLNERGILSRRQLGDLQLAITEVVTNGLTHGTPPVTVRCWAGADRIVTTVTDRGRGPKDPFAGLQAAAHAPNGGFGLWLAHQLCDHVAMTRDEDGFTLRLISGDPYHRVGEA